MRRLRKISSEAAPAVVRAAERLLGPDAGYGVFAVGIDGKRKEGRTLGYRTLTAYVERKSPSPGCAVPPVEVEHGGESFEVVADVVGFGRPRLQQSAAPVPWTGLHPGCAIELRYGAAGREWGGVAALVGAPDPAYLVTAGHLFARDAQGMPVYAAGPGGEPFVAGELAVNLLDAAPAMDAALVKLNDWGVSLARETTCGPQLHAVLPAGTTGGRSAQAFLSTRCDYSYPPVSTVRSPHTAILWAGRRGEYIHVRDTVRTQPAITAGGDSGTILVTATAQRWAIGICSGASDGESLFEPLELAIERLSQIRSETLPLWQS